MKNLFAVKRAIQQQSIIQKKESATITGGLRLITNSERIFENKKAELTDLGIEYSAHQKNHGNGHFSWELEW